MTISSTTELRIAQWFVNYRDSSESQKVIDFLQGDGDDNTAAEIEYNFVNGHYCNWLARLVAAELSSRGIAEYEYSEQCGWTRNEFQRDAICVNCDEDDEDDEDGIPSYHSRYLSITNTHDAMGTELETYQSKVSKCASKLASIRTQYGEHSLKWERDGSLDSNYGVEIVGGRYTLSQIRCDDSPWKKILSWCRANSARAWQAGTGYGLHISVDNRSFTSQTHILRFMRLWNDIDNQHIIGRIAGRTPNQYCLANSAKWAKPLKLTNELRENGDDSLNHRYRICADRGHHRLEIRVFRATLRWDRFVANHELVAASREYTRDCGMSDFALRFPTFLSWLCEGLPRKQYSLAVSVLSPLASLSFVPTSE